MDESSEQPLMVELLFPFLSCTEKETEAQSSPRGDTINMDLKLSPFDRSLGPLYGPLVLDDGGLHSNHPVTP